MKTIVPIQALRALAALSVVLVHYSEGYTILIGGPDYALLYPLGAGVDVFFVSSGFMMFCSSAPQFGEPGAPISFLY